MSMIRVAKLCLCGVFLCALSSQADPIPDPPADTIAVVPLNPNGTYLFVDTSPGTAPSGYPYIPDYADPATEFDLTPYLSDPNPYTGLRAGDVISVMAVGDLDRGSVGSTPYIQSTAVFANASGLLKPGPVNDSSGFAHMLSRERGLSMDIPEDVLLFHNYSKKMQIPSGATKIKFSPFDNFFADNSDPNGNYKVYIIREKKTYYLEKTVTVTNYGETPVVAANPDLVEIRPSISTTSLCPAITAAKPSTAQMTIKCIEVDFNGVATAVGSCQLAANITLGASNGGHSHGLTSTRPLGTITPAYTPNTWVNIPVSGLTFTLKSSDVSGDVNFDFRIKNYYGDMFSAGQTVFRVKVPDLVNLDDEIPGFEFVNITSHPNEGTYAHYDLGAVLYAGVADYYSDIVSKGISISPGIYPLRSEAASLSWGGLFDINQNWKPAHCAHRDGRSVDISMSVIKNSPDMLSIWQSLEEKFADVGISFPVDAESRRASSAQIGASGYHWHATIQ